MPEYFADLHKFWPLAKVLEGYKAVPTRKCSRGQPENVHLDKTMTQESCHTKTALDVENIVYHNLFEST